MRKLSVVLLAVFAAGSLFAGAAQDQAPLIGIAMPETHVLRWIKDGNSLRDEAVARGYRAEVQWADGNQAIQNQQVQSFLTQGARVLVIGNINDGVGSVVTEARRDGVHVIAYDRIIQGSGDYDYYITFNNFKVGELQGQIIADALNLAAATSANPRRITLFAGSPTDANANFFFDGAMSILLPHIDRGALQVVGPFPRNHQDTANFQRIATEGWNPAIAKARMENLLTNEARDVVLDAVLAPNDTLARSIIEALRADARYRDNLPATSGQDAEFDSMISIRDGGQTGTVFKDTAKLAEAAILLADQILRGIPRSIPGAILATGDLAGIGHTGVRQINAFLLDPVMVTRSNINVPVDAGFFDDAEAAQLRR